MATLAFLLAFSSFKILFSPLMHPLIPFSCLNVPFFTYVGGYDFVFVACVYEIRLR